MTEAHPKSASAAVPSRVGLTGPLAAEVGGGLGGHGGRRGQRRRAGAAGAAAARERGLAQPRLRDDGGGAGSPSAEDGGADRDAVQVTMAGLAP